MTRRNSPCHLGTELPAGSPKQSFKVVFFQLLALTYSGAFLCAEESVFSVLHSSQLERVENAHQRPKLVNTAVSSLKKKTFSLFTSFSHLVNVRLLALDLHRKRLNRLQNGLRDCLSLSPQEQNMPPSTLRVSTTKRTPRALKTHISGIAKTRSPPRCHALTTQGSHNSSSSFRSCAADSVLLKTADIYLQPKAKHPQQRKSSPRFTSTSKPISNNPARASSAEGRSRFETQRNHGLSTQTQGLKTQHTHNQKKQHRTNSRMVGLPGFEPGSRTPEAHSLDQTSRQPQTLHPFLFPKPQNKPIPTPLNPTHPK